MKRAMVSLGLLFALLVPLGLAACGDDDDETTPTAAGSPAGSPAASAPATRPAKQTQVTVGYIPILIYAPLFVGIDRGYFADEGIELKLERLAGGADMLVQTAAGNFNVGAGGIGAAAFNAAGASLKEKKAVPFEIVAPLHSEKPPVVTPLVISKARYDKGEITKVADLKGKKVSINARGAATEYWLDRALATGSLGFKDISLQTVPFADVAVALQNGSIDGAMLGEPFVTLAKDQGLIHVLSNDFVNGEQPTALYWNREWAQKNPELAAGFLRAYLKAVGDLEKSEWKDDAILAILEKYTQVKADVIKRASRPYNDPTGRVNVESFKKQEAFFRAQGSLTYEGQLDFSAFVRSK